MANRHNYDGLRQLQSLPLKYKIQMTEERIRVWYDSWVRYEIVDLDTKKTRYVTFDSRAYLAEPPMKESEFIKSERPGQVYLSFSGGKDSTVLRHIVKRLYPDVPCVFVDTGLEYPEVRRFATEHADVVVRPKMRFDEVIKTYGYPVASKETAKKIYELRNMNLTEAYKNKLLYGIGHPRGKIAEKWKPLIDAPFPVSSKCCDVMKKQPARSYEKETGRMPIVATMACESFLRQQSWQKSGCNAFDTKKPTSRPMSFWTEQDVLQYIKDYDLEYASVYGDIIADDSGLLQTTKCDRTGCMFCLFGITQDGHPNRIQRMKETHPRQYEYCMRPIEEKGLGLQGVLEYIGVPYE